MPQRVGEFSNELVNAPAGKGCALIRAMARDHRKLDAFKLADTLALDIYKATSAFPTSERYGLQSQLRRSAVSAPTNIVEGCAREPEGDFLRFLGIAFSSCRETIYLVSIASRLQYLTADDAARLSTLGDRAAGALMNLRRSIQEK